MKSLLLLSLLLIEAGLANGLHAQQKQIHVKVVNNGQSVDSVYTITYNAKSGTGLKHTIIKYKSSSPGKNSTFQNDSLVDIDIETADNDNESDNGVNNMVMVTRSGDDEDGDENGFPFVYTVNPCDGSASWFSDDSVQGKRMRKKIYMQMDMDGSAANQQGRMRYSFNYNGSPSAELEEQLNDIPLTASADTTLTQINQKGDTITVRRQVLKDGKIRKEITINKNSNDTTDKQFFAYNFTPGRNHFKMRHMPFPGDANNNFDVPMPPMPPGAPGMKYDFAGMPEGIDENADFGRIKVSPLEGKNLVRISLDLSGKENTVIKINDEKGKTVFEEKVKDLTGKYVRDIDMSGNEKGKYSLAIDRGKSSLTKQFTF